MKPAFTFNNATIDDIEFISGAIIEAEKSNTDNIGLAKLFELTEEQIRSLLKCMLNEETDGCEFSLSSYIVARHNGKSIAAVGGWIESFNDTQPSKIIKSNLISFLFPKDKIACAISKHEIIKDILIAREDMALQIENVYVNPDYRGNNITIILINKHIENALNIYPELNKCQVQVFKNNMYAIRVYEKMEFRITNKYTSGHEKILNYLPDNEKYLMEKKLK